jgi:oxygen-independent coproporphyrinogen-3 oxidase
LGLEQIQYIIKGHDLHHEVQSMIQVFYPNLHYYQVESIEKEGMVVESIIEDGVCKAIAYNQGEKIAESAIVMDFSSNKYLDNEKRETKRYIKTSIYNMLTQYTGVQFSWGILTGIRPAKNVNELWEKGASDDEVRDILTNKYLASLDKVNLAIEVARAEQEILKDNNEKTAGIYIGIPFCPTRCLYCSFTSFGLVQYGHKVDAYMDALIKEIQYIADYSKRYQLQSIYIGGGTPTALNETQLELLLSTIQHYFDFSNVKEFTVEAGRPDTITTEKLQIMKKYNVGRISINPQTMNQKTLDTIGRRHSVEDIKNIFDMARQVGHNNINMDIILGLPGETPADVENTMNEIIKLNPENITVHTLAVKRASRLKETINGYEFIDTDSMEKMLAIASYYSKSIGMYPYYMYRQRNMVGNFENIGYCKPNMECIYNIQIMEEKQTILSAGAGSTTKLVYEDGKIDRIFNVKSLDDYINRIDEMILRKKEGLPK